MTEPTTAQGFGWRPDLPDYRDAPYKYSKALKAELVLPADLPPRAQPQRTEVDRHPVRDQGSAGSCVGHGVGFIAAVERNVTQRSPLFIYYEARRLINETDQDNGAYIRDGIKVAANLGAPRESLWAYDLGMLYVDPAEKADTDAAQRKVFSYHRLETGHDFRSCLASRHLFTIGFTVYSSFNAPLVSQFGICGVPSGQPRGGHCVAVIGYDDEFRSSKWAQWARSEGVADSDIPEKVYECQNSWGSGWARGGRFVIAAEYLENTYLADDAWTLRGYEDERR